MMNKLGCFILAFQVLYCNCQTTTLTPVDPEIKEGDDVTFVCTVVSGTVKFVSWSYYHSTGTASYTAYMNANNDACTISQNNSFLLNTNKYSYKCTSTVYRVTVKNVQRSEHNRRWSCIAEGQSSGPISTIKVQYKAEVTSFKINENTTGPVIVDVNSRVLFKCVAEGNPIQTFKLTNSHGDSKSVTTQTLNYIIDKVRCIDDDTYTCSASNLHNDQVSKMSLQLHVICPPRAADTVEENMKSEIGASFTFTFNAIAYPRPEFTWWIWDTDTNQWSELSDDGNITLQSFNLTSSLTITKVSRKYFTRYKLEIKNNVGTMTQKYTLSQYEKPASLGPLIGGIVGGIAVLVMLIIVGIVIWRRYPLCQEKQENKTLKQRQAAVSSSSESESDGDEIRKGIYAEVDKKKKKQLQTGQKKIGGGDIYAEVDKMKKKQPKEKGQKEIGGDIYAEVDRKKKMQPKEKMQKGKVNKNVEDTCENANINTNEEQKSKIVNKYGLNYADLVFNNKTPGEKTKVSNESVPYDAVDFTKKAEPLPDDDDKKA